jgi:hypothetical protein
MSFRPLFGSLVLGSMLALSATAAFGQSTALDRTIIAASGALNDGQKSAVAAFVGKLAETIRTGDDARAVEEARAALTVPARDPAATASFRKAYGQIIIVELGAVAKGSDLRRALNAMQALRFTRTPEALDVVIERTAPASEPNAAKRIAAASLVADAFEDLDASNAYYETAARRLRDASGAETDWIALQQKLSAIGAAARRKELPADNARNVRKAQAEAIAAVAKAIKSQSKADARMQAIQRTLVGLRNDLLVMQSADRSAVAKVLAPALSDLVGGAAAQWDSAHADAALTGSYASVLNNCEVLLRLIDRGERPQAYAGTKPEGDARVLGSAWESKDKAKFEAEATRWAGIVSAAPYRN